jgi:hypothetical protein
MWVVLVVVMQRVSSFKDPPFDACKCPVPRAVLKHFLGDEVLLGQMRMPLMLPDQFKAILCADYVNHVDAGQGVYVLGAQQMCKSCYKWVRGLVSSEPLKQASLTVRRGVAHQAARAGRDERHTFAKEGQRVVLVPAGG